MFDQAVDFIKTKIHSRNSYRAPTPKEISERVQMEAEIQDEVKRFTRLAQEMMEDRRYAELYATYRKILSSTLRLMIWYDAPSLEEFFIKMRHYQSQLRTLTAIIDVPKEFVVNAELANKESEASKRKNPFYEVKA